MILLGAYDTVSPNFFKSHKIRYDQRCIAINGQWEDFLNFVHNKIMEAEIAPIKLLQDEPAPLPDIAQKAA